MYNQYQQGYGGYGYPNQNQNQQQQYMQNQATGFYQNQQPGLFQGQQTGFQPQYGFQQQPQQQPQQPQLNPQATGYAAPQSFNSPQAGYPYPAQTPAQPTGFSQPQATLQAQKTGFSAALATVSENNEVKIPSIRLSFITAADQTKFEHLFRTAVLKGEQAILGDQSRDILLRSGLAPVTLAEIWALADTNKLGSLLFPEFALALHLCNLALRGDALPGYLPEKWLNEVQSFVDAISFAVPEDPNAVLANTPFTAPLQTNDWMQQPATPAAAPAPPTSFGYQPTGSFQPSLTAQRTGGGTLIPLQPQQTAGFVPALQQQKTGPIQPQTTGYQMQPQTTGYQIPPQRTGSMPSTSFQAQQTGQSGLQALQQQQTGFQAPPLQQQQTGFQPQQTGFQPQQTGLQPQQTGYLQAQPTGKPGEWGFVSMPTGGIPGLNAMQQHFLPSSQLPSNNLQSAMGGSLKENVTWKITKQEKQIYDGIFAEWDSARKGFIDGDVAISIFSKSGLGRPDLESIWNLCDGSNRGKLNKDEFAVAMHLVYRRLNGFDIPLRLPTELIPPSAKYLQDSVDSLKNSLKGGSKKASSPAKPVTTASRFKNDDDDVGYVSNSRHRSRRPGELASSVPTSNSNDLTTADLKKMIHEKQILLDALDLEDQHSSIANKKLDDANNREIESLKSQIRATQAQLNKFKLGGSQEEKKLLLATLDHYTKDKVPTLMSKIYKVNADIAKAKGEVSKSKLKKQFPDWLPEGGEADIVGTGPNGEVTESDKRKYKSKQLLKQRMAALTGKSYSDGSNKDADLQYKQDVENANRESEDQSAIIKDIESSIKDLEEGATIHLQVSVKSETSSRKWDEGDGVSSIVKSFIQELSAYSRQQEAPATTVSKSVAVEKPQPQKAAATPAAHKTPEDRAAYIKAQAEKRMNERLAKLGISRNRGQSTSNNGSVEPKVVAAATPEPVQKQEPVVEEPKVVAEQPATKIDSDSSDEDDAEYAALLKQKKEMESRKKDRELKKKQDKEARMAKLKKEMEALENGESSDEEAPAVPVPLYKPNSASQPKAAEFQNVEPKTESKPQPVEENAPHKSNPFAKVGNNSSSSTQNGASTPAVPGANTNPFFKLEKKEDPVDQKKLAAQRASQRGLGGDDDWSDQDENSSDDDEPNRAGAAKLASLLFGGMPQPMAKTTTGSFQPAPAQPAAPVAVAPAVPQAAPPVPQAPQTPKAIVPDDSDSDSNDEFATPSPQSALYDLPASGPSIPTEAPPMAPPLPTSAPPLPSSGPPIPNGSAPPPPPPPFFAAPAPPPPPPPVMGSAPAPSAGIPNMGALLGQITGGKSLKKVDSSQQKIADSAVVGRVL